MNSCRGYSPTDSVAGRCHRLMSQIYCVILTCLCKWKSERSQPRVRATATVTHMHTNIPVFAFSFRAFILKQTVFRRSCWLFHCWFMQPRARTVDDCSLKQPVRANSPFLSILLLFKTTVTSLPLRSPPFLQLLLLVPQPATHENRTLLKTSHAAGGRLPPKTAAKPPSSSSNRSSCLHIERKPD